jgi:hypothetical protein
MFFPFVGWLVGVSFENRSGELQNPEIPEPVGSVIQKTQNRDNAGTVVASPVGLFTILRGDKFERG